MGVQWRKKVSHAPLLSLVRAALRIFQGGTYMEYRQTNASAHVSFWSNMILAEIKLTNKGPQRARVPLVFTQSQQEKGDRYLEHTERRDCRDD